MSFLKKPLEWFGCGLLIWAGQGFYRETVNGLVKNHYQPKEGLLVPTIGVALGAGIMYLSEKI